MLSALEQCFGIVTRAAQIAKVGRSTHYEWVESDPAYKKAVEAVNDVAIDFVESKLFNLINQNDTAATIFYLKTKAKKRGYIERSELTGADGGPIQTQAITGMEIK